MSVTADLSDEVLRRLQDEAARRGVPVESLIAETLERDFPPTTDQRPTLSFIGLGEAREDLGENHKQICRDLLPVEPTTRDRRRHRSTACRSQLQGPPPP